MRYPRLILSERVDQSHLTIESFTTELVPAQMHLRKCTCATVSTQYIELVCKLFNRAIESGRSMGGCNSRNNLPINVPKCVL